MYTMARKTYRRRRPRKNKSRRQRSRRMYGGSANLDVLPKEYYYEYNQDPVIPPMTGGKRRRRRLRGGMDPLFNSNTVNTLTGSIPHVNSGVTSHPAANPFSMTTIPNV
jgi:hypothetical protein